MYLTKFLHADYEYSDQTVWIRRLIRVYVRCICQMVGFLTLRLILMFPSDNFFTTEQFFVGFAWVIWRQCAIVFQTDTAIIKKVMTITA